MTIDKAIKNLTAGREDCGMIPPEEYTQTIDLAIKALEEIREARTYSIGLIPDLLPGETKE